MQKLDKEVYLGSKKYQFSNNQGVSIISTEYREQVSENWHSHQNAHITLFLKGGTIEKRKSEDHIVTAGSILFYHSDEVHLNQKTLFPSENINIEFDEIFLKKNNITEEMLRIASGNPLKTKSIILKMYKESLTKDIFTEDSISMLLSNYASDINYVQNFSNNPNWVKMLFELLNDNWNENMSLNYLSKILNINPISISKHFPQYFGCTYGEYMRRLRINKSISLIQKTSLSLTEIALECGFSDQSHFIRTFKEYTQFLPKEFKSI
ncbi:MAG: helix-turn-helix transcriptional regulator [Saprospiraceae bacterium]|nr:helix-turn-helix transcriptional regulator [Saprospiraceae bacterium]MBK9994642.1 helix-turn-helix transcriptional regulator [Saprospiraceae bacterium]